ncbi:WD40 repeat-like protein [Schizopora paradoxa]|uniref:WD40 repeat-like protein n=1 Tax=Schizopora paradoxa TaxID=27342 RepID=A0A0H2RF04_9AGAM|nr:WD40 repeat-like protein [Schizopora paradoxa]
MNGKNAHPFSDLSYPTAVQASLQSGASFARYDPTGKFVVAGLPTGRAAVWDLDTKAPIRWLQGHVKAVTSADWSRNSRFVLTASKDWNVVIWDLASDVDPPQRYTTIRFDAPVLSASFHPRNMQIVLVLLATGDAYLVDLRKEFQGRVELVEEVEEEEEFSNRAALTVAKFDPSGRYIFVGTSQGTILVFNTRSKTLIARHKIAGAGVVIMRGLGFTKGGRRLITNSSDRTLRQFNLPIYPPYEEGEVMEQELEPTLRFSDPIGRVAWHNMAYSPDGEWLAGGSADPATHQIYIWNITSDGSFVTALDGGREPLLDVTWHPSAPAIASTTNSGNILLWHCPAPERWGAFAGGFEEMDENVVYEEREDEFDIEDEAEITKRKQKEEDEYVDVMGENEVEPAEQLARQEEKDEDILWAESEPDKDDKKWTMKVLLADESDY